MTQARTHTHTISAETSTRQHTEEIDVHAPGQIKTRNPCRRPQTRALGRTTTGIGLD